MSILKLAGSANVECDPQRLAVLGLNWLTADYAHFQWIGQGKQKEQNIEVA